jgi:hypothetical protein
MEQTILKFKLLQDFLVSLHSLNLYGLMPGEAVLFFRELGSFLLPFF